MRVREFHMADYGAVVALWRAAGLHIGPSDQPEELARKLERDPDLFLVGVEHDVVVGAVIGAYDGRRAWIYHLAVHPSCQKRGLGAALLAELEDRLRGKGCLKVNLLIEPDNARVQHFYEQLRYRREELIFMGKWLA